MSNVLSNYLNELEVELIKIQRRIKLEGELDQYSKELADLKVKIKKVNMLIKKKGNTFLIKTKRGYLSSNGQFTDNVNLAYTYGEEEAVRIARQIDGWLEEMP